MTLLLTLFIGLHLYKMVQIIRLSNYFGPTLLTNCDHANPSRQYHSPVLLTLPLVDIFFVAPCATDPLANNINNVAHGRNPHLLKNIN